MSDIPFNYRDINEFNRHVSPSTVHTRNNALFDYFRKYLMERVFSVYKISIPEWWKAGREYFLYSLFNIGFMAVTDISPFSVIPQHCTINGQGVFYQPTDIIISNPAVKTDIKRHIGGDCVLLRLKPDFTGISDIVNFYADKLALFSESVDQNIMNTKLAYVFASESQNGANSFKKMFDEITAGEPAVFVDRMLLNDDGTPTWQMFEQNLTANYIASDLLSDMKKTIAMFDSEIGIPNCNTDKRERLVTDEVNQNNIETYALSDIILESLQTGFEECHTMFSDVLNKENLWIEYRNEKPKMNEEKEGEENVPEV